MCGSDLRSLSHLRDPEIAKHGWAVSILRRMDDSWTRSTVEWIRRQCALPEDDYIHVERKCSLKKIRKLYSQLSIFLDSWYDTRSRRHAQIRPPSWTTVAQQRDEWNMGWGRHN
ncbi:hypothetical protein KIN20_012785 [Parelaphostrongylus tenuis]|uniref:Uncharacterized protein n=1 Tax=Parelaphostrongylus tenuis TaxID=148309 RepID=A0AAD5N1E0_PARTN|nr:hypothetical protein KIN20_012785 [Parelaphostrongylus tenuis]